MSNRDFHCNLNMTVISVRLVTYVPALNGEWKGGGATGESRMRYSSTESLQHR